MLMRSAPLLLLITGCLACASEQSPSTNALQASSGNKSAICFNSETTDLGDLEDAINSGDVSRLVTLIEQKGVNCDPSEVQGSSQNKNAITWLWGRLIRWGDNFLSFVLRRGDDTIHSVRVADDQSPWLARLVQRVTLRIDPNHLSLAGRNIDELVDAMVGIATTRNKYYKDFPASIFRNYIESMQTIGTQTLNKRNFDEFFDGISKLNRNQAWQLFGRDTLGFGQYIGHPFNEALRLFAEQRITYNVPLRRMENFAMGFYDVTDKVVDYAEFDHLEETISLVFSPRTRTSMQEALGRLQAVPSHLKPYIDDFAKIQGNEFRSIGGVTEIEGVRREISYEHFAELMRLLMSLGN